MCFKTNTKSQYNKCQSLNSKNAFDNNAVKRHVWQCNNITLILSAYQMHRQKYIWLNNHLRQQENWNLFVWYILYLETPWSIPPPKKIMSAIFKKAYNTMYNLKTVESHLWQKFKKCLRNKRTITNKFFFIYNKNMENDLHYFRQGGFWFANFLQFCKIIPKTSFSLLVVNIKLLLFVTV